MPTCVDCNKELDKFDLENSNFSRRFCGSSKILYLFNRDLNNKWIPRCRKHLNDCIASQPLIDTFKDESMPYFYQDEEEWNV